MNRKQISLAQQLFFERDQVQTLLDTVDSGKGVAVSITSAYQPDEVVAAIRRPLRDYYQQRVNALNAQLKQLGWSGQ